MVAGFTNRPVAIVTGAAGGIGAAVAAALDERGYRLVLQGFGDQAKGAALAAGLTSEISASYHWSEGGPCRNAE
ncbi:SDR family NAD(P)-dependent oxidoreductase [Streptomyces sp. TRM68367]|uniref:SDR family NAD(P)-dependent oxidoreductase n=1 Tax=Streptomyces sp. TRM68367 TaxID=2758415 RepID=UPI00165C9EA7|nr:SDR family NAD(P)-dependent oxidoreductase [Streptomyces sp. TRM68367]MBC9726579.1 SDR family NAD(P)-dependent oxidoreductase [Streptomyces sp. TRM68367]